MRHTSCSEFQLGFDEQLAIVSMRREAFVQHRRSVPRILW